ALPCHVPRLFHSRKLSQLGAEAKATQPKHNKERKNTMNLKPKPLRLAAVPLLVAQLVTPAWASSHMDAPLITLDPAANTTDVYAFVQNENGVNTLVTALGVYPFEEPGIGPNKYNFDDNVLYQIHVALGSDAAAGRPTLSYQFRFT